MLIPFILYIVITILSFIAFKSYGLFILLITTPLLILYHKVGIMNKRSNDNYLSERKEVEFVSTRDRKKGVKPKKERIKKLPKIKLGKRNNKSRKESENKKSIWRRLLTLILGFFIVCIFMAMAFIIYIVISAGSFDPDALKNQDQTVIYDKDGEVITTLGAQKRESVTYDDLPQVLVDAIVATEDSRYYQHNGVDTLRFVKATLLQLIGKDDAGGASTLTMQTVKNNLTKKDSEETNKIKKIVRKFQDVYLSVFFMEKKYTKEEILELYVNDSCLGGTVYGVQEASKYYFGKDVSDLTLPEASLLAGMYQAPNRYNPYKDPEAAQKRRETVLKLMVRHGYITKEEMNMANAVSIESMLVGDSKEINYQGYIDTVLEEVERKTGNSPVQVSMKIYTALDRDIQDGINKVLSGEDHSWEDEDVQAGIAVINVNDGTIAAIGAGRNRTAGDWNYATQSYRQPGSTAKPIFDYGPGFEYNHFSTYTLFVDEPWSYTNGPEIGNWDGNYEGLITLRRALSVSRNIPALKAFQQVNKKNIAEFAQGLGLDVAYSTKDEKYKKYDNGADNLLNEAYAIGGVGYGFTPLDMAEAYSCFANGGYHIESHAVTKIEYRSTGEVVEFADGKTTEQEVNKIALVYGIPSGAVNDLWTVAYTPEYSVSLWYGYKEVDSSHYLGGASAPKDAVMRSVMKYIPKTTKEWTMPSSVVQSSVERDSWPARLPSEYTPDDMRLTEYFVKGYQPTEVSERFAKLPAVTNLKSTPTTSGYKLTWNWKTPEVLNNSYLTNYFSNSVFGNSSSTYLSQRINYNESTLGGIGFGIYKKSSTGLLERIDFTKDQEYVYKPDTLGDVNLVVKAEYGNFKANASDAADIKVSITDIIGGDSDKLEVTLKQGTEPDNEITEGSYNDPGIDVKYNGKEVLPTLLRYEFNGETLLTKSALEAEINKLKSGESAKITYKVTYLTSSKDIIRNIKIK